jgi:hypothetical protein
VSKSTKLEEIFGNPVYDSLSDDKDTSVGADGTLGALVEDLGRRADLDPFRVCWGFSRLLKKSKERQWFGV